MQEQILATRLIGLPVNYSLVQAQDKILLGVNVITNNTRIYAQFTQNEFTNVLFFVNKISELIEIIHEESKTS